MSLISSEAARTSLYRSLQTRRQDVPERPFTNSPHHREQRQPALFDLGVQVPPDLHELRDGVLSEEAVHVYLRQVHAGLRHFGGDPGTKQSNLKSQN